jgi:hypothetical protein
MEEEEDEDVDDPHFISLLVTALELNIAAHHMCPVVDTVYNTFVRVS